MLDEGANDRGRPLGPQGHRGAALVGKGVHFLLDNVGGLADRAAEQFGLFQNRHADLAIAEGPEDAPGTLFQKLPGFHLSRQDVVHPLDSGNAHVGWAPSSKLAPPLRRGGRHSFTCSPARRQPVRTMPPGNHCRGHAESWRGGRSDGGRMLATVRNAGCLHYGSRSSPALRVTLRNSFPWYMARSARSIISCLLVV